MSVSETVSAAEARRISLAALGLSRPRPATAGTRQFTGVMTRLRTVQIDSVNVFARSHYLPFFSRLGPYDQGALDRQLMRNKGRHTEYWAHMATFIPTQDWGLFDFRMQEFKARYDDPDNWFSQQRTAVDRILSQLAENGPMRPSDFASDVPRQKRGAWWDWDVTKRALEYLWLRGDVAIAERQGFTRSYALADHVIPEAHRETVSRQDAIRELVNRATATYGIASLDDIADYWRLKNRTEIAHAIHDLEDSGDLKPVVVGGWGKDGGTGKAWMHRTAVLPRRCVATTILSPFDPLVWYRPRTERLFSFHYRIEIYTPAHKRQFGYYSLPVLSGDRLVGRVDLKSHRETSTLRVQSAWWEEPVTAPVAEAVAREIEQCALWQQLESVSVSSWGNATQDLAAAIRQAARHEVERPIPG